MSITSTPGPKDAHYHRILATELWSAFVKAEAASVKKSAAERAKVDAKRRRETTYARGELGGH